MTALALATRPAYPLGKPADRDRFGMTQEQAYVYNWLVKNRPHDRAFAVNFRQIAIVMASPVHNIHARVIALCERGWLQREDAGYRFVHPIMKFPARR